MNTINRTHFYVSVSVLAMLVLAITACGSAEVDNIEGRLTQDGTPAVGIIVRLRGKEAAESEPQATQTNLSQETKTDDNGRFAFQNVPPGSYEITIEVKEESQGMNCTYNKYVTVEADKRVTVDIEVPKKDPRGMSILPNGDLDYVIICVK